MSGLEIAAAISGVVSAFVAVGNVIGKFREKRKEKEKLQSVASMAEIRLLTTVQNAPPRINTEYNNDLTRIGHTFAQGDGTSC